MNTENTQKTELDSISLRDLSYTNEPALRVLERTIESCQSLVILLRAAKTDRERDKICKKAEEILVDAQSKTWSPTFQKRRI